MPVATATKTASKVAELEREAVEKRGDTNQRERFDAGVLPEDEILALARAELFAPLSAFKPWHNRFLRSTAVRHKDKFCHGTIEFETAEAGDVTHDEWETVAAIRRAADIAADHHWIARSGGDARELVRVELVRHFATCADCKAEESRASARVSITWAGRVLTREYAL